MEEIPITLANTANSYVAHAKLSDICYPEHTLRSKKEERCLKALLFLEIILMHHNSSWVIYYPFIMSKEVICASFCVEIIPMF